MAFRGYSDSEKIPTWQAYGERVPLICPASSPCLNLPDLSHFQTAFSRTGSGSNICTHLFFIELPNLSLKPPFSLCIILSSRTCLRATITKHLLCESPYLALAISVNPHHHLIGYAIIFCKKDGDIEAHRGQTPWPNHMAEKRPHCSGCSDCSALAGSKECALNCALQCPTELMQAFLVCQATNQRGNDLIHKIQHQKQGHLASPGSLPTYSVRRAGE